MQDFTETAEFVRRFTEKMRDITALGDALKMIGSVNQAAVERQAALDKLTESCNGKSAEIEAAKVTHAEFLASRDADLAAHRAASAAITDAAGARADEIVNNAEVAAREKATAAASEIERIQAEHVAAMATANNDLQKKLTELGDAQSQLDTARTDYAALVENIQRMKDLARTALGAVSR